MKVKLVVAVCKATRGIGVSGALPFGCAAWRFSTYGKVGRLNTAPHPTWQIREGCHIDTRIIRVFGAVNEYEFYEFITFTSIEK